MDLSSALAGVPAASPATLLLLVGLMVTAAAVRTVLVLFRLIGVLVRSIVQLLRSVAILVAVVALIAGWSYQRFHDADIRIEAPAPPSVAAPGQVPSLGPVAPHD